MADATQSGTFIQATLEAEEEGRRWRDLRDRYYGGDETFTRADMGFVLNDLERLIAALGVKLYREKLGG